MRGGHRHSVRRRSRSRAPWSGGQGVLAHGEKWQISVCDGEALKGVFDPYFRYRLPHPKAFVNCLPLLHLRVTNRPSLPPPRNRARPLRKYHRRLEGRHGSVRVNLSRASSGYGATGSPSPKICT